MSDKLKALFQKFVVEVRVLLIAEVQDQLATMAGGGGVVGNSLTAARAKPGLKPKGAPPAKTAPKAKWAKRSAEELEALTKSVLAAVKKGPGQRSEQLAATLNSTTKDLSLIC